MANDRTMLRSKIPQRQTMSAFEARVSLLLALASQSVSLSQRVVTDLVAETASMSFPRDMRIETLKKL
ncbi:hypothetical protein RDABS01_025288 [Bienertia sinuspersici]